MSHSEGPNFVLDTRTVMICCTMLPEKYLMLTADRWWWFLCLIIVLQSFLQVQSVPPSDPPSCPLYMCVELVPWRGGSSPASQEGLGQLRGAAQLTTSQLSSAPLQSLVHHSLATAIHVVISMMRGLICWRYFVSNYFIHALIRVYNSNNPTVSLRFRLWPIYN